MDIEQMRIRMGEMAAEIDRLNAEREKQSSPVVAVPDGWKLVPKIPTSEMLIACAEAAPTLGSKNSPDSTWTQWAPNARWKAMVDAAPIAANPSPRITEQDALDILSAFEGWDKSQFMQGTYDGWFKAEGRALLNKLNAKPEIPAGWHITYDPKPIPDRSHDYDFWHDNYDGADGGNGLCGTAKSHADAIAQIKEIEIGKPESVGG